MSELIWLGIGLFIGVIIGFFLAGLMAAAKRDDHEMELVVSEG